ncbi:unnamed protein product [Calypogeia fissa]
MAPPSLPMASWTLIGAVIGATVTVAWRAKPSAKPRGSRSDCKFLLPRFFLILALQENLGKLLDAVDEEMGDFCDTLEESLTNLKEQLLTLTGNFQSHDGFKNVLNAVDAKLVPCLQKAPSGPSVLEGYLPKAGQTWDALLTEKVEDDRRFLDAEINDKELQEDLTISCLYAIDRSLEMLQQAEENATETLRSHSGPLSNFEVNDFNEVPAEIQEAVSRRYTVVKVFYATDRRVTEDGDYIGEISRREFISGHEESNGDHPIAGAGELPEVSPLEFGIAEVGIPGIHGVGGMEAPHAREESSPLKHVQLQGELLIFIHGYNVSHKGALKRAAQLKYDLQFQGAVIAYSWSSRGTLYGYSHDEATVKKTVRYLESFLLSIMQEVKAPRAHILAHSMGNRALIRALDMLHGGESFPPPRCRLSEIIFAAADESHSIFEKLVKKMRKGYMVSKSPGSDASNSSGDTTAKCDTTAKSNAVSYSREDFLPHLTVYCSTDDWALKVSRFVHDFRSRLGDTRSFLQAEANVDFHDVVDASGMDISSLHHSYYGDVPEVIQDLKVVLTERIPASSRPNLHAITHLGTPFYAFNERRWALQGDNNCALFQITPPQYTKR